MTAFEFAKFLHVLATIVWVGGALLVVITGFRIGSADPAHRLGFARDAVFLGRWVFTPAIVVALGAGIWMVLDADPAFTFSQTWIVIGLGVLVVSGGIGTGFIIPQTRFAIGLAESGDGPGAAGLMRRVAMAGRVNVVLLLAAVWVMVFKPGL
jgi:uncharacterized membrane protein